MPSIDDVAAHPELSLDGRLLLAATSTAAADARAPSSADAAGAVKGALAAYQQSRVRDGVGLGILSANRWLISGTIGAAAIVMPPAGALAALALGGTTFALDALLGETVAQFSAHTARQSRVQLASHLEQLREEGRVRLADLSGMEVEDARAAVFGDRAGFLAQLDTMELDEQAKAIVESHLTASFEDAVTQHLALDDLADEGRDVRIEALERSVSESVATQRSLLEFQEQTTQRLGDVEAALGDVQESLEVLHADVGGLRDDLDAQGRSIEFLESFAWGRMSTREQREALERGHFASMPAPARQRLEQQLEAVERRERVVSAVRGAFNGAAVLADVAGKLGVDADLVQDVQRAASIGNDVLNGTLALSQGDWIGALKSVSSLLGGPDAATRRHQQVMSALGALQRGQQHILENQRKILERQRMILENQRRILEALSVISAQIRDSHESVMEELSRQRDEIRVNRDLMAELLQAQHGMRAAIRFLELRGRRREFDFSGEHFASYAGLARHYEAYPELFEEASRIETAVEPGALSSVFRLVSYSDALASASVTDVRRAHALLLAELSRACTARELPLEQGLARLLIPSQSFDHAEQKWRARFELDGPRSERLLAIQPTLAEPVALAPIEQAARWAIETHYYFQLFEKPFGDLRSADDVVARQRLSPRGAILLDDVALIVDGAIAQRALMSGDLIVEHLVEGLIALDTDRTKAEREDLLELLQRSSLLALNVVRRLVQVSMRRAGVDPFAFEIARGMRTPRLLRQALPGPWEITRDGSGWGLSFDSARQDGAPIRFAIPDDVALRSRSIGHHPELMKLLALREDLVAASFSYDTRIPAMAAVLTRTAARGARGR